MQSVLYIVNSCGYIILSTTLLAACMIYRADIVKRPKQAMVIFQCQLIFMLFRILELKLNDYILYCSR